MSNDFLFIFLQRSILVYMEFLPSHERALPCIGYAHVLTCLRPTPSNVRGRGSCPHRAKRLSWCMPTQRMAANQMCHLRIRMEPSPFRKHNESFTERSGTEDAEFAKR